MAEKGKSKENKLGEELGEELSGLVDDLGKDESIPESSSSMKGGESKKGGILGKDEALGSEETVASSKSFSEEEPVEIPEMSSEAVGEPEIEKKLDSTENANIYRTKKGDQPYYRVTLPDLSDEEREIMSNVRERAIDEIDIDPRNIADIREREEVFKKRVREMLKRDPELDGISTSKIEEMSKIIVRDMIGFGMLDVFLEDDNLEDVLVTATSKPVYVYHRDYGMCITNISFEDDEELVHQIEKMARYVGRRIDQQNPLLDATLPDGSRVNATIPPVSLDGPTLSIRKFREDPLTVVDIIDFGTISPDVAAFLWLAVEGMGAKPSNILISGGTASGKSTTMNAISAFVPGRERIISIEDTAELHLPHEHWVRLETRPPNIEGKGEVTMEDLVKNALRMRPDRIMVGEVRGPEAQTMFTGMNTGHDGCLGTVHSNSAMETITRLAEDPMGVPEVMIPALDAVVMQKRLHHQMEGQTRRITEIAEVTGFEDGQPQLSRIYEWNPKEDEIESTGVPSTIKKNIADFAGVSGKEIEREIKRRATVLEWMREENIRDIYEVGRIVEEYYRDKDSLLNKVESTALNRD